MHLVGFHYKNNLKQTNTARYAQLEGNTRILNLLKLHPSPYQDNQCTLHELNFADFIFSVICLQISHYYDLMLSGVIVSTFVYVNGMREEVWYGNTELPLNIYCNVKQCMQKEIKRYESMRFM